MKLDDYLIESAQTAKLYHNKFAGRSVIIVQKKDLTWVFGYYDQEAPTLEKLDLLSGKFLAAQLELRPEVFLLIKEFLNPVYFHAHKSAPQKLSGIRKYQEMYEGWWLNRLVYQRDETPADARRVVGIKLVGPPSFVYGNVWLVYENGDESSVRSGPNAFRPRKSDIIVIEEEEE